jgi:DNA polymerase III alpha subunit
LTYVELHARSAFSFLEGASLPEELVSVCKEYGMPAMALLDRDGVYGSPRFYLAAKKQSIEAHIGAEVTSEAGWRYPTAGCVARRISEFVPSDYADEIARAQGQRLRLGR